ncbi:hypothetical protein [Microtetraspora malaysiensis]|uniref:hypothetical protein n=1 Tax=Microtetraspora malaysiensis TaxID=161358 RepID=UPI003D91CCDD
MIRIRGFTPWATATATLLAGRTTGPIFLADRRAPTSGSRAPAAADICPIIKRG